ncbi:threonine ammonia-lyase [Pseudovibrio exalbescens]|uniref:Pyridoxal-5'-phosphate-dependent protein n=1 Tax=Pseudovibrio exalbescens TaxID=197461 RepID=A0A1U7JKW1_9HYPH|nr:threonine/serine dehydratase [Pseudovibrio exalbescens]OKL45328.1 pyridoxal-5'-phosphate-dependent protein [Pseudovibrio exalbescens]
MTSINSEISLPDIHEVEAARQRLRPYGIVTPLLRSPVLDELTGATVLVKAENLQRTGSFKFRGAFNRLSLIPEADRPGGVVACSSGNHAQGVAAAARLLGMRATIVMPSDAPELKRARTVALGARVVLYDRQTENREQIAQGLAKETGATFIHPYNDPQVIAGQGTVGLEIADQAKNQGLKLETMVVCTGGGGLASGVALALSDRASDCRFHTAEPAGFDDYARSLRAGHILKNDKMGGSVCDAVLTPMPGEVGFEILKNRACEGAVVSDEEALKAVAFAFHELKLVIEPGGAVALAAVLFDRVPVSGRVVALTLSGGNIDPAMMALAIGS